MLGSATPGTEESNVNNLKSVRQQLGWSQSRAISAIRAESRAAGVEAPAAASLKTQLSRWENGHRTPDAFYRRLLERTYGKPAEELGIGPSNAGDTSSLDIGRTSEDSAHQASQLWDEDMNRRDLLHSAAFTAMAFAGPAVAALVWSPVEAPSRINNGHRVDDHDIQAIQQMTAGFSSVDNKHGGGQIRRAAVGYLTNEVAPLLTSGQFNGRTGGALFVAAAELTQLVGWMSHDIGSHGLGQRYLIQALGLARSANDEALMAEILAAMSHQATYLGQGAEAVDLARAARQLATHRGVAALVAEAHVMEAHGYAALGQSSLCATSVDLAEKALDSADRTTEPHWIGYFDEAYLSAKFGHCFRVLGDNTNAINFAERSLNMNSQHYARGHAFNLSLLAHAHAQAGDVDQACTIAQQAVTATSGLRSERAFNYLDGIRTALKPARSTPSVVQLDQAVEQLRTAA